MDTTEPAVENQVRSPSGIVQPETDPVIAEQVMKCFLELQPN